ncbi:ABC transporter ATP-binding protein [Rhizobium sp. 0TCS1.26]|uniref:ABC transporter ATP-binding protein n=1 Tax=Rhizobium sp. 0TCS1.26 TaxID=3142623 RepID=UPI003D2CD32D
MSRVLEVSQLAIRRHGVRLVEEVSLSVAAGETLCLVGESGCGKSLTCMATLGLLSDSLVADGSIELFGHQVIGSPERPLNQMRGRDAAMIFQNPMVSLNPIRRIGEQIDETLALHTGMSARQRQTEIVSLLDRVGISEPERHARSYPSQLSGGMCQRVMIAMAIACRPRLLIADEPTTALDVTIQAQILKLLKELQAETGMAMVLVTHDLGVVAEVADRVAVMYAGRVVEEGPVDALFEAPQHPYTQALMNCRVDAERQAGRILATIPGTVPAPSARPAGCSFSPRCSREGKMCATQPVLNGLAAQEHRVACHFPGAQP